jgi:hypothetical protein
LRAEQLAELLGRLDPKKAHHQEVTAAVKEILGYGKSPAKCD